MAGPFEPPTHAVAEAVERALAEDLTPLGDLTSMLLPDDLSASASFVARREGVVAGAACVIETFDRVDPSVELTWLVADGGRVERGTTVATVTGRLASILTAERTALNFLSHLSGVATTTNQYVQRAAAAGSARIWDTRKTTPGLRSLEKAAVRAGGGANHRGNLSDWILLKDNHLALMGITGAVTAARDRWPGRTVHVECDREDQALEAVDAGADALLLDNMDPDQVRACVAAVEHRAVACGRRRPLLEVSGEVDLDTVGSFAATGVDLISVGAITKSAPVLDIGLDIS
jgi:nicotinate-nucleotide pyrophosphorylase (carboxylating)